MFRILMLILLLQATPVMAFEGVVTKIHDGDTLIVINEKGHFEKIRLYRIDSPEMKGAKWGYQPYANEARDKLISMCAGKVAIIVRKGVSYDRTVGDVTCSGLLVSNEMIATGNAWAYKYTSTKQQKLFQSNAKAKKRGLWALDNPIEPLLWRKGIR